MTCKIYSVAMLFTNVVAFTLLAGSALADDPIQKELLPFSSPLAIFGGSVYGQAIGVTSIVFGDEPTGPPQTILFSGLLKVTKKPLITLGSGQKQIELKFDSTTPSFDNGKIELDANGMPEAVLARSAIARISGQETNVLVWVDPDEAKQSTGQITEPMAQINDTEHKHGEEGDGEAKLYLGFFAPGIGILHNKEPIILNAHIHHIPPVTHPIPLRKNMTTDELTKMMQDVGGADKWIGVNKKPTELFDSEGNVRAYFTAYVHETTLTGTCDDSVDNDVDGNTDEEKPNNVDDDKDGFTDEDSICP